MAQLDGSHWSVPCGNNQTEGGAGVCPWEDLWHCGPRPLPLAQHGLPLCLFPGRWGDGLRLQVEDDPPFLMTLDSAQHPFCPILLTRNEMLSPTQCKERRFPVSSWWKGGVSENMGTSVSHLRVKIWLLNKPFLLIHPHSSSLWATPGEVRKILGDPCSSSKSSKSLLSCPRLHREKPRPRTSRTPPHCRFASRPTLQWSQSHRAQVYIHTLCYRIMVTLDSHLLSVQHIMSEKQCTCLNLKILDY